jgi:hypothetical protein
LKILINFDIIYIESEGKKLKRCLFETQYYDEEKRTSDNFEYGYVTGVDYNEIMAHMEGFYGAALVSVKLTPLEDDMPLIFSKDVYEAIEKEEY